MHFDIFIEKVINFYSNLSERPLSFSTSTTSSINLFLESTNPENRRFQDKYIPVVPLNETILYEISRGFAQLHQIRLFVHYLLSILFNRLYMKLTVTFDRNNIPYPQWFKITISFKSLIYTTNPSYFQLIILSFRALNHILHFSNRILLFLSNIFMESITSSMGSIFAGLSKSLTVNSGILEVERKIV